MEKLTGLKLLTRIMQIVISLWVAAQIAVLFSFWGSPQYSDPAEYLNLAKRCFDNKQWYPMVEHVYSQYIFAPGFVNFLILQLKIFGSTNVNGIFNLLMNLGIIYEIHYLGKKFFNNATAKFAVIGWCLMYSNTIIVAVAGTEIPFLFLSLSAFCLCLSKKSMYFILAGFIFAISNWIRPLIVIFIPSLILFLFMNKYKLRNFLYILLPFLFTTILIGVNSKLRMGYFIFQSTTSGVNLIMTSNDKAYGGVATTILNDTTSTAYIKHEASYPFFKRDSIWKARSIIWIKANPVRATGLYFKKLGGLFVEDSWADRPILGGAGFLDSYMNSNKVSSKKFKIEIIKRGAKSFVYYLVLILFFYTIIICRKELLSDKGLILLILIIGTLLTAIFAVSPRYHYPFTFVLVLFASYGITIKFRKDLEL